MERKGGHFGSLRKSLRLAEVCSSPVEFLEVGPF